VRKYLSIAEISQNSFVLGSMGEPVHSYVGSPTRLLIWKLCRLREVKKHMVKISDPLPVILCKLRL